MQKFNVYPKKNLDKQTIIAYTKIANLYKKHQQYFKQKIGQVSDRPLQTIGKEKYPEDINF